MSEVRKVLQRAQREAGAPTFSLDDIYLRRESRRHAAGVRATAVGLSLVLLIVAGLWVATSSRVIPPSTSGDNQDARTPISVHVSGQPVDVWAGPEAVWVVTTSGHSRNGGLVRLSPETGASLAEIEVGQDPTGVAVGPGLVWVSNADGTITTIDPATNQTAETIVMDPLPSPVAPGDSTFIPSGVATSSSGVWVATARGYVAQVDPESGDVLAMLELGSVLGPLVAFEDTLWVSDIEHSQVVRINATTGLIEARLDLQASFMDAGTDGLWIVTDAVGGGELNHVSADGVVTRAIALGASPGPVSCTEASCWLGDADGRLTEVDKMTGNTIQAYRFSGRTTALSAGGAGIWATTIDQQVRFIPASVVGG